MKKEYDFSRGERGKFYRPDAKLRIPIYLDEEALVFALEIAERRKKDVSEVVSELLKSEKRIAKLVR